MSFWEKAWEQAKKEQPNIPSRPKNWLSFWFVLIAMAVMAIIWFPIRLLSEIFKAIDLDPPSDQSAEMRQLFQEAYERSRDLPSPRSFAASVLQHTELPATLETYLAEALAQLYRENILIEPKPIPDGFDELEAIRWRDEVRQSLKSYTPEHLVALRKACLSSIEDAAKLLPELDGSGEITSPISSLTAPGRFVAALVEPLRSPLLPTFSKTYDKNIHDISGVATGRKAKPVKLAQPWEFDDPTAFLVETPFSEILDLQLSTDLPEKLRNSHHWVVAGTGAGKTTLLHYVLKRDLEACIRGERSLIVMDSQRQLILELASLKIFAPGQPLDGKLCVLDAADIEFPIAINLFDMRLEENASLSPLDRAKLKNSAFEMYEFIIGSLLDAEMTARQSTLFRFVLRLVFVIPGATIFTFHDILKNGLRDYHHAIATLDATAQKFFETEFNSGQFTKTKEEVAARLWAVIGEDTFAAMFSAGRSKIDFFKEINTPGKVILINAEKGLLQDKGTELFGRFFLALINQAAARRSSIPKSQRLPCRVIVDECHNYIRSDPKIQVILSEARQQQIGLLLAHQHLGQLTIPVQQALSANTSIRMASKVSRPDLAPLAQELHCVPNFLRDLPEHNFATFLYGTTRNAITMRFPENSLAAFEKMTPREYEFTLNRNRELYARPLKDDGPRTDQGNSSGSDSNSGRSNRRDPD